MTDEEKFRLYASKVDTPQKIEELCRKYLEKKGSISAAPKTIYIGRENVVTLNAQSSIGREHLDSYGGPVAAEAMTRKELGHVLLNEIMSKDLISWASMRDICTDSIKYNGRLHIWKEYTK